MRWDEEFLTSFRPERAGVYLLDLCKLVLEIGRSGEQDGENQHHEQGRQSRAKTLACPPFRHAHLSGKCDLRLQSKGGNSSHSCGTFFSFLWGRTRPIERRPDVSKRPYPNPYKLQLYLSLSNFFLHDSFLASREDVNGHVIPVACSKNKIHICWT